MTRQKIGQGWGTSPHPQILANQLILIWPNFYISSNLIWTSFNWFDPTWSNLVSYDPILSKLISLNPIWFNSIWFELVCSYWSGLIQFGQFGQNKSHLIHFALIWPNLNHFSTTGTNLIWLDPIWSSLILFESILILFVPI